MELVLETAGESHGPCLVAILAGIPAGTPVDEAAIDAMLAARQRGYGRSARQATEVDRVRFLSGVRDGVATGNPMAIEVHNLDTTYITRPPVFAPRPGHADLAGALNRGVTDAREVVERASARETAVRVAAGAVAAGFLEALGVTVLGHVVEIGGLRVGTTPAGSLTSARGRRNESDLHALGDPEGQREARRAISAAAGAGDTLGGVVEVVAEGVPVGLGGHERPEEKLSARLAAACIGIQAVRGFELGLGFASAALRGSAVHDAILPSDGGGPPRRASNRVGGIEGGTSNGQPIVVRLATKPLATLRAPLPSIDLRTGASVEARVERSDVTAVPALAIVAEAVVAIELARAIRRRFGGAHLDEVRTAMAAHRARMASQFPGP